MAVNMSTQPSMSPVPLNYTPVPYGTQAGNQFYVQTGLNTGMWSPIPASQPSVLGTSAPPPTPTQVETKPQTTGGLDRATVEAVYRAMGWNDMESAWQDATATNFSKLRGGQPSSGPSAEDLARQKEQKEIEDLFGSSISALGPIETSARAGETEALGNIGEQYKTYQTQFGEEEKGLRAGQAEQERLIGQTGISAADEARRSFSALQQQGRSRFGAGSSAGGAVSEIAAQEFARTQGRLGQAQIGAQQQLGLEAGRLNTFISGKKNDLDSWKRDAEKAVRDNLTTQLNQITLRKGELEDSKRVARLNLLQQARADLDKIKDRDFTVRSALASSALENAQTIAGRAFTAQEVAAFWNQMMNQLLIGVGPVTQTRPAVRGVSGKTPDELAGLILPGVTG